MNTIQYTIRGIPREVDRVIRKKAKLTGMSLNQLIVSDITKANGVSLKPKDKGALTGLEWFIGAGTLDDATMRALEDDDRAQKAMFKKEMKKLEKWS